MYSEYCGFYIYLGDGVGSGDGKWHPGRGIGGVGGVRHLGNGYDDGAAKYLPPLWVRVLALVKAHTLSEVCSYQLIKPSLSKYKVLANGKGRPLFRQRDRPGISRSQRLRNINHATIDPQSDYCLVRLIVLVKIC